MPLYRTAFAALLLATVPTLPAAKILPYPYTQEDLANGLRVITMPTDFPNLVALNIIMSTGSRNEVEPGKSGFAHLFEHMMFRGTPEFPPAKYQAEMRNAGADSNGTTTDDATVYFMTISKEDLPRILSLEADRFQHLEYSLPDFKTETLAVLGEYNKNSASPFFKIIETVRATAFTTHTYRHSAMGFLTDIQAMPGEYDYSRQFFERYYRPEYTTILVVGDVDPKKVRSLIDERWGQWKRGSFQPRIPVEPAQESPRIAHIDWPSPTSPIIAVAYHAPAFSDNSADSVALNAISRLGFGPTSPLYQKLVIEQQKCDSLSAADSAGHVDPDLFTILSRVKNAADLEYVQQQITSTAEGFATTPVDPQQLETLKKHLRYEFSLSLNDSESIAVNLSHFVALRRTPEAAERYYDAYARVTPEDIQPAARKYLTANGRTIVTLTSKGAAK